MNNTIFYFFYNFAHQSGTFDQLIIFFAVYFPYIVALSALLFLFYQRASLRIFVSVLFSVGLAGLLAEIFKKLIHFNRPFIEFSNVHSLFSETGFAFPSGHATLFSALAVSLFFYNKKAGYWFMCFALLIGVARIVAGVHFPADILGGFILGALASAFIAYLSKYV